MRILVLLAFVCSVSLVRASSWEVGPWRPVASEDFGSATVGEMFFTLGGATGDGNSFTTEVWVLNLSSGLWTAGVGMPDARYQFQAVAVEDCIYFAGGANDRAPVATSNKFNTTSGQWAELSSLPSARTGVAAVVYDGDLASGYCVIGGVYFGAYATTVECYDIAQDLWVTAPSLNEARTFILAASFQGSLYAFGGNNGTSPTDTVEVWSGSANSTWEYAESLPEPLSDLAGAYVGSSEILVVGGGTGGLGYTNATENGAFTNEVFLFDFEDHSYSPAPPYPIPIKFGAATSWNGVVTYTSGLTPTSSDSATITNATYVLYAPTPTPAPAPPTDSVAEQVANVAVPITVAGAEVTAAAISLAPTLLAAAHGLATTTQPLSVSPLIWITFAYTQHIALTIFFPGSLPDAYNAYASLFSWTIGMAPFGVTFPFQPTNTTSSTTTTTSGKRGSGLARKLLDVDDAAAEYQVPETQLLAAMLFWVMVLLLAAVAVVPLVMALILTVQRNRLEARLNENSGDGLSEQNPLVEKTPATASFTLQEENQSTADPGGKERPGLRYCLEMEASKPPDSRRSSYAWFAVCFLSSLVLVFVSVLSLFYSSLLTLCATQMLLPWSYGGSLGTVDKAMVALACFITLAVGLGIPLWSAAAAYVVRSDKEPSFERELTMVPSVRKFKARTAFFGLVIYFSMFANAWLVALLQNQALAFYAASVLVQMFVFCGIFFTRPYKQRVVFAWQLVSSAAITLRLAFLTILMYQQGEGATVSWVLVALPITLDTFVICGTLMMSVKGFFIAIWKMCRSRCKSSRKDDDENANL